MQMAGCRHRIGCTLSLRRAVQTEREREREKERNEAVIKVLVLHYGKEVSRTRLTRE